MHFQARGRIVVGVFLVLLAMLPAKTNAAAGVLLFVKLRQDDSSMVSQTLARYIGIGHWQPESVPGWFRVSILAHQLASLRDLLSRDENVLAVEEEQVIHAALIPNDTYWPSQWGAVKIGAPLAWDVTTGDEKVIIAIVDSGTDIDHPDLSGQLWVNTAEISGTLGIDDDNNGYTDDVHGWSFIDDNGSSLNDDYGHGTHVAGIAAAQGNNGLGVAGVCWKCRLMILKVLDSSGDGTYADVAEAVMYAMNNGARVINLSLGGTPYNQELNDAVEYAYDHGVLSVAAVGNYSGSVLYPAAYDRAFAVAATDQYDQQAVYSNYGPQVDVSAPGNSIYSTCGQASYCTKTGSSMSTPFVSGLAGLVWSRYYTYTVSGVEKLIMDTAVDVQDAGWDEKTGWGRIDAQRALSWAMYVVRLPVMVQGYTSSGPQTH